MFRPRTLPSAARSRSTHARPSIVPRVDGLEPRLLLAKAPALVQIVETPDGAGSSSVQVIGTKKNDVIFITDDGKHAAGSLRITANGITQFISANPVTGLSIATDAGKDQVSYNLAGGLAAGPSQSISVSSGSFPGSGPKVKGGGNLQVTANLAGTISENSSLILFVAPDKTAATSLIVNQTGAINGNLGVGIASPTMSTTNPRTGPTTFRMMSTGTIGKDGNLGAGLIGGANRNMMDVSYFGTNDGNITIFGIGRGPKDILAATVAMNAGSTGTVGGSSPTQIIANGKTPRAQLLIARGTDTTSTTGITAQLSTTSRKSVTIHTANVMTLSAGKDTVLS